MNVEKIYNGIPDENTFLQISIANYEPEQAFHEYNQIPDKCVCIYGVSEQEIDQAMIAVRKRADYYVAKITESPLCDHTWDVECKPILLVDTKESAFLFQDFANLLDETTFCSFILELQLSYNNPWTHVQMLTHAELCDIIACYTDIPKSNEHSI